MNVCVRPSDRFEWTAYSKHPGFHCTVIHNMMIAVEDHHEPRRPDQNGKQQAFKIYFDPSVIRRFCLSVPVHFQDLEQAIFNREKSSSAVNEGMLKYEDSDGDRICLTNEVDLVEMMREPVRTGTETRVQSAHNGVLFHPYHENWNDFPQIPEPSLQDIRWWAQRIEFYGGSERSRRHSCQCFMHVLSWSSGWIPI